MRALEIALLLSACSQGPALTWETTSFASAELAPGEETTLCYYLPADGRERFLSQVDVTLGEGSHHLIVVRVDERNLGGTILPSGPADCKDSRLPPGAYDGMMPAAQSLHSVFTLPDGVALKMEGYHGLQFRSHYLNATGSALRTHVTWRAGYVERSSVREVAGMLFYVNGDLNLAPGYSSASATCGAQQDLKLVSAMGHMHMHGLTFDATVGETRVYHNDNWDAPVIATFGAGLPITAGTPISWTCAYDNPTDQPIEFGPSATDEMCTFVGIYYPAVDGETIGC